MEEGVLFKASMYMAYIRESYSFSPVCTSKKAIKKYDVRKEALSFRGKLDNKYVSFIHSHFQSLLPYGIVLDDYLVHFC